MARQLTRSAVRIYGALSALGNGNGNVMEGLLPFFEPILRRFDGMKLDPDTIASAIRDTYRWNFNADLVEAFAPYLERQGWISADIGAGRDTSYTIKVGENGAFDASEQTVERELREIAIRFKHFAEELSPLTTIPREIEEFEDILVEWLLYVEAFSEKSIDFKTGIRADASGVLKQFVDVPKTTVLRDEEKFLCARFVKTVIEENDGGAELLAKIAAIGLLTEVVQDFVKPVTAVDTTNLVVYLDAPVAMELLGLSGKSAMENTRPIIAELTRIGASVRVFGQSIDEIKRNLQAMLSNSRPTGPTAQSLMRGEVLREYVVEASRHPERFLESFGVKTTYRTITQFPSDHAYFTEEQHRDLYGMLSYVESGYAREHDADITAFVVRLRRGKTSPDIFKSHAIVLTRNGLLAQIVRRACVRGPDFPEDAVPPVVHRRVLATAMWLRTGMGASDLNIPKRMLLASCEHVLAIRPGIVDAVKRITEALGDEQKVQQLDLLISQDRSAQALMDKTLGVSNVITEENLPILWNEMLHPHLEQERQKRKEEISRLKADSQKRLDEAKGEIKALEAHSAHQRDSLERERQEKLREDREAIEALCLDAKESLERARRWRMIVAFIIAAAATAFPLIRHEAMEESFVVTGIGLVLSYLTITGGKLIGTNIDEAKAIVCLQQLSNDRRLTAKLEQFEVMWSNEGFKVSLPSKPVSSPIRVDLLDFNGSGDHSNHPEKMPLP